MAKAEAWALSSIGLATDEPSHALHSFSEGGNIAVPSEAWRRREKATSNVKKEVRGVAGESHAATADRDTAAAAAEAAAVGAVALNGPKKTYTTEQKNACSIEAMKNGEICEACQ